MVTGLNIFRDFVMRAFAMVRKAASSTRWVSPEQFPIRIAGPIMMRAGWMISAQRDVEKTSENGRRDESKRIY